MMKGGMPAKAMPTPLTSPIPAQKASVAGSAQTNASLDPFVRPEIIIPPSPMTTPIDRSMPPSRMVNPCPKEATARKIADTRIDETWTSRTAPGLANLMAIIRRTVQTNIPSTGAISGDSRRRRAETDASRTDVSLMPPAGVSAAQEPPTRCR